MAFFTKRLPVCLIPEQPLIASVRNDMIHHCRRDNFSLCLTESAQRMLLQEESTGLTPAADVPTGIGTAMHPVAAPFHRILTEHLTLLAEARTAGTAAGSSWFWGILHLRQIIKGPRRSQTDSPPRFFMALSGAMTSATAPSTFSVDFSLSIFRFPAGSVRTKALSIFHRSTGCPERNKCISCPKAGCFHFNTNQPASLNALQTQMSDGWGCGGGPHAVREQEKKKPRQRFIDEVWPGMKPG